MRASGAGDNLPVATSSLHLCSSLFRKVRTAMCLGEVQVNLKLSVTLSDIFLSKLKGLRHLRVRIIPVRYNPDLKEISYLALRHLICWESRGQWVLKYS